ncbi:MAG: tRNA (N(6)-L-threonylcarbamoyladenosine(37)-C(2))-methylthiotransferase MtaB [Rickettsiales bacterium]
MSSPGFDNVVTFGCRLNIYESEIIRGYVGKRDDVIVVNSCAVTAEAERQVRQTIRKLRREHPLKEIVVTGCAAQIAPEKFRAMPEVSRIVGNGEKTKAESYLAEGDVISDAATLKNLSPHMAPAFDGRTRAFLEVQNGCDHRCTFCVIPFGRGDSRSSPAGAVVERVRRLVEQGYKEVVLTGVDVSGYGGDLPGAPTLGMLIKRILAHVPELPRLRLSSIDVAEVDKDIWDAAANEPRFMPYFHLSLQAGDDMILKRMKRRHSRADALRFCAEMRKIRPETGFGADVIAGFPTETDEMFLNTLRLTEEAELHYLHVFPYSAREGTPAAKMPQVPKPVRKERAAKLREAGDKNRAAFLRAHVGKELEILAEADDAGRSPSFIPATLPKGTAPGSISRYRVIGTDGQRVACDAHPLF